MRHSQSYPSSASALDPRSPCTRSDSYSHLAMGDYWIYSAWFHTKYTWINSGFFLTFVIFKKLKIEIELDRRQWLLSVVYEQFLLSTERWIVVQVNSA